MLCDGAVDIHGGVTAKQDHAQKYGSVLLVTQYQKQYMALIMIE